MLKLCGALIRLIDRCRCVLSSSEKPHIWRYVLSRYQAMSSSIKVKACVVRQDSKTRRIKCTFDCADYNLPDGNCKPMSAIRGLLPRSGKWKCTMYWAWITLSLLGLFAMLHIAAFLTEGELVSTITTVGKKASYLVGRAWRYEVGIYQANYIYPGYSPPFTLDSMCSKYEPPLVEILVPDANLTSNTVDYDICLVLTIGDDTDRPNDGALPFPLVNRLLDIVKYEAQILQEMQPTSVVELLVGVDYGSVVCKMVRDFVSELPGVRAKCSSFQEDKQGTLCGKLIVGDSKRFLPQMSPEWTSALNWVTRRSVDLDCSDSAHEPPAIPESEWRPTVVTGFSSNHLTVGLLMLRSIGRAAKEGAGLFNISLVVWAMERFKPDHQRLLDCVVDELNNEYNVQTEVRLFEFDAHPPWMRINQALGYFGGTGEYAWKAVMVHTVLRERGFVLWADAGDRFQDTDSLIETLRALNSTGFVSRKSAGTVWTRTHPLHLKYFRANLPEVWDLENCEAAIVGFTLKKYKEVARPWYDCALTRQCIAPDGSDRSNHRQDQAALTLISVLTKNPCRGAHPHFCDHLDDDPTLHDLSGAYTTKCYFDPLILGGQGTLKPHRHH